MTVSLRALLAVCLALLPVGCANMNFFSEDEEARLGVEAYAEETGKYPLVSSGRDHQMLMRLGQKIAAASEKDYQWEFKLLKADDVPNAFCLPGGKVAVYTGILPLTQNEGGLAAVVGHEVAHATLRHGGKRMTQHSLLQGALAAVQAGLGFTEMSAGAKEGILTAFGVGANVGLMLPYSRQHETEADEIGLRYAIRAGYDPWEAPKLWERMAALGSSGPAWLSTHPDPLARAENLRAKIPQFVAEEQGWQPKSKAPAPAR